MEENDIKITYDTLFELLRREKNREELQKLDDTFYIDVVSYLKDKFDSANKPQKDLFSLTEKEKSMRELRNTQKILKELYERREKKIVAMAISKSRTGSELIDTSNLLKEEESMFNSFLNQLDTFRNGVMDNVLDGKLPSFERESEEKQEVQQEEEKEQLKEEVKEEPKQETEQPEQVAEPVKEFQSAEQLTKKIKFLGQVAKFVGPELEEYGPYELNETAALPSKVAMVLIDNGRAEELKE